MTKLPSRKIIAGCGERYAEVVVTDQEMLRLIAEVTGSIATFAVKVTIKAGARSGTKFVTRNSGKVHTVKTLTAAHELVAKCKKSAVSGVKETYEIVQFAKPVR